MEAFTRSDHAEILFCLTEDVEWVMPGAFHLVGTSAFDKENISTIISPTNGFLLSFRSGLRLSLGFLSSCW
jgi:hypothetical protein